MFGLPGDVPVSGDYDGNGVADVAMLRPSRPSRFSRRGAEPGASSSSAERQPASADELWPPQENRRRRVSHHRRRHRGVVPEPARPAANRVGPPRRRADARRLRRRWPPPISGSSGRGPASGSSPTPSAGSRPPVSPPGACPATCRLSADVDNDHKLDFVVFRPSTGTWHLLPTSASPSTVPFGLPGDIPLGLDVDGNGLLRLVRVAAGLGHVVHPQHHAAQYHRGAVQAFW